MTNTKDEIMIGELDMSIDYDIYVRPTEDSCPVFHVNINYDGIPDSLIFLTEPKYYGEDSLKAGFSKDGLAIIDNFMKEPSEHDPSKTNWEYLCNSWNELSNNKISFPKTQPDYTATSEVI